MRGLQVALLEKEDFASGTSSTSTKLIHGGLRYLERFDLRLVFESCRERRVLQTIAPHLVQPMPFYIPVYRDDPRSLLTIRAGLTLYDLLALFRNTHRHRILSAREALRQEPVLRPEGLTGLAVYWDCRMDDARLCLENALAAAEAGAEVVNYLEVVGLLQRQGRVAGVRARDLETAAELEIEAEVVVNAAGPWLDRVCALDGETRPKLRPTRGSHILVPRLNQGEEALYLTAGRDERMFFVIPWGELSLIGTTDVDFPHDPDSVTPTGEDIDYLLAETARHLQRTLDRSQVVAAFSGLRPLVAADAEKASRVSREHRIHRSPSGLISIAGGKYTTYRSMAAETAALVTEVLGRGRGPSRTHQAALPGGLLGDYAAAIRQQAEQLSSEYALPPATVQRLQGLYGIRTSQVLARARQDAGLLQPVTAGSALLRVQVVHAVEAEFARTPADVLRRRTSLALETGRGLAELDAVTELLGERLRLDGPRRDRVRDDYLNRHGKLF